MGSQATRGNMAGPGNGVCAMKEPRRRLAPSLFPCSLPQQDIGMTSLRLPAQLIMQPERTDAPLSSEQNCKKEITNSITAVTIKELVECTLKGDIRLPPIQRSAVWTNAQIINFWDSLLRGYPAGMMFVNKSNEESRDFIGNETKTNKNEGYDLFDGQQRVNAILLAHDIGFASKTRRLWIDFSREPSESSGLKFQLRMSSVGQPFGYDLNNPNQKAKLSLRREKWVEWDESHTEENSVQDAFNSTTSGEGLIYGNCDVIQFSDVINQNPEKINQLSVNANERYKAFKDKLEQALSSKVIFLILVDMTKL
jgi:Uncharacterized conserved protein